MKIRAYAKINLGLHIIGKRADGFHNIETIFHRINLFDELTVLPSHSISLSSTEVNLPNDSGNLCWKAAELLRNELGTANGISIHIMKSIPIGAGLGGGSSDAAAVLRSLPKLWNVSVPPHTLELLALQLGSDVPFFLRDASAYATGRGEVLQYRALKIPYWIVVVTPNISINTAWAYNELSKKNLYVEKKTPVFQQFENNAVDFTALENDFEKVVFPAHSEIGEVKTTLQEHGAIVALMSGSGSSVFGLFEQEADARRAAATFKGEYCVSMTEPSFIPN
ncbi:MAG: 4-(cytidine 5'-diphospho)-2-C-methyl-D-erythritol kinase [Bacteroidota bacterium]|nr:4-(cytidine 5'-diphospho)-2-C-methyl-D-erythritol kinase [Bacteroidota bacterium]